MLSHYISTCVQKKHFKPLVSYAYTLKSRKCAQNFVLTLMNLSKQNEKKSFRFPFEKELLKLNERGISKQYFNVIFVPCTTVSFKSDI